MPYTAEKPTPRETPEQLRARIPGWGADLDPADRPSYPKEQFLPTGAHWDFPERQVEKWPRERSIEHAFVTPVFGTSTPPKGLSGVIRKYAYRRFSEARAAHWLLLIAADRVDTAESAVTALLRGKPDNPVTETGILAESSPVADRVGQQRADAGHHALDPVIVAAPWVIGGGLAFSAVRALVRRRRG
ncbi:hypothetical protein [Georgenia faecalis]|uniref:Uncharacterized protein n=1 Tax=Georgenia faecalis TaxID=2483799 RepID=A0ABV9D7J5_9MICO|nr:hypothetical protein [Georgenia faecalis]